MDNELKISDSSGVIVASEIFRFHVDGKNAFLAEIAVKLHAPLEWEATFSARARKRVKCIHWLRPMRRETESKPVSVAAHSTNINSELSCKFDGVSANRKQLKKCVRCWFLDKTLWKCILRNKCNRDKSSWHRWHVEEDEVDVFDLRIANKRERVRHTVHCHRIWNSEHNHTQTLIRIHWCSLLGS